MSKSDKPFGKAPAIQWYPDKWIADTRRLSWLAKSHYHEFLMVAWMQFQNEDCGMPDDDEFIALEIGAPVEDWKKSRIEIMNPHRPLLILHEGRLFNNGLFKEKTKLFANRKKQSENGSKGGRPKGSKNKKNKPTALFGFLNTSNTPPKTGSKEGGYFDEIAKTEEVFSQDKSLKNNDNKPTALFQESQTKAKKSLPTPTPSLLLSNNISSCNHISVVGPTPSAQRIAEPQETEIIENDIADSNVDACQDNGNVSQLDDHERPYASTLTGNESLILVDSGDPDVSEWDEARALFQEHKADVPYLDIEQEIIRMKIWKRKSRKNELRKITRRFVGEWVSRVEPPMYRTGNETGGMNGEAENNPTLTALGQWKHGKARARATTDDDVAVADAAEV